MVLLVLILCGVHFNGVFTWESLPNIPNGRRSEYYALNENGHYKYGYDTGDGIAAKQSGNASNQVEGHYFYKTDDGKELDLKYSAGTQGFVPQNLNNNTGPTTSTHTNLQSFPRPNNTLAYGSLNLDGSYIFGFNANDQIRQESADANNNVQGSYWYKNSAGTHDLSYIAGAETGFKPTGGSLANPNSLVNLSGVNGGGPKNPESAVEQVSSPKSSADTLPYGSLNADGSYRFQFTTNDQSRYESADASNNVKGSYSFKNSAGNHDLSYIAGAETGFKATGGSLSIPNGLTKLDNTDRASSAPALQQADMLEGASGTLAYGSLNSDGSYRFGFTTNDQSREKSADARSNVKGRYSYKNSVLTHDLSYTARANSGLKGTGGSLSIPNGLVSFNSLNGKEGHPGPVVKQSIIPGNTAGTLAYGTLNPDGFYRFGFTTNDQNREESAYASNSLKGSYSYKNSAGTHNLSYIAGAETGFKSTDGNLSIPVGATNVANGDGERSLAPVVEPVGTRIPAYGSLNADGSYKFGFTANDQSRQESADANNNVQGSYWYKNSAGPHDLSYVAGSETGFQPTGGSLSIPNGLPTSDSSKSLDFQQKRIGSGEGTLAYGSLNPDGPYAFGSRTDNQCRQESTDAKNNIEEKYSYKNSVGTHDMGYIAGEAFGFKPARGSLSVPIGLKHSQLNLPQLSHYNKVIGLQDTKFGYEIGNLTVHTYLPPSNEKHKFGYIFDTKT